MNANTKYFTDPRREYILFNVYRLTVKDINKLARKQRNRCLYCLRLLPKNVLNSLIDHIGGDGTRRKKNTVRGLVCSHGCNRLAGRIEKQNPKTIKNILRVLKINKGRIL